jgi:isopentenyl phosphate kinase
MADFCRFIDGFGVLSGEQMVPEEASKVKDKYLIYLSDIDLED